MDLTPRSISHRLRSTVQLRTATTLRSLGARFGTVARARLRAVLLLAGSLGLLSFALDAAGTSRVEDWIHQPLPSMDLLTTWAQRRGFHRLPPDRISSAVWRSLPSRGTSESPVWLSSEEDWLAFFVAEGESGPVLACRRCETPPNRWLDLGQGWEGIRSFAHWAEGPIPKDSPDKAIRAMARDPREFRY